jgi:DNA-directed RNA polymerase subunit RPC12/RpoP
MMKLEITCPYCQEIQNILHDGLFTPRYAVCKHCGEKFIYEPRDGYVAFFKLGEADCYSDPDCRALEMCSYSEE